MRILLLEPNYKNKYPPIGLMKIATYHRILGDDVIFYKGDLKSFEIKQLSIKCIYEIKCVYPNITVNQVNIIGFIRTRKHAFLEIIREEIDSDNDDSVVQIVTSILLKYKSIYWEKKFSEYPIFDRIYISTLFTFYWKVTFETINFAKRFLLNLSNLKVGGVMATVLFNDIVENTNITPIKGLLDKAGIFDDNDIIIDHLPLDYSILEEISYKYPTSNSYYGYLTRGCIRKCRFCAVPIIEPNYQEFISLENRILYVEKNFGKQKNLLLLDNNVLASKQFDSIIDEIKNLGFYKGAKFSQQSDIEKTIICLKSGLNDRVYIDKTKTLISNICSVQKTTIDKEIYKLIQNHGIDNICILSKESLLSLTSEIEFVINKFNRKKTTLRYVDFNQGVDARLINDHNIKRLSEIAIRPLRIAFDSIRDKDVYTKAIELSAQNGIRDLSNYILYNENDKPEDLYERLRINVDLSKKLDINIYSFPMKYLPITGEDRFDRQYLGKFWNRKFIRSVQVMLNATKGKIGKGESFFNESFGRNLDDFMEILYMPESFILYRKYFRDSGLTMRWREDFYSLKNSDFECLIEIIKSNDFSLKQTENPKIRRVLNYYHMTRKDAITENSLYFQPAIQIMY